MDSLHAFPKLAEGVGQFMASFASLERFLWELYGKILGTHGDGAIAMLGHIESFSIKLTAMQNYLPYCQLAARELNSAAHFLDTARECNTFRNALAHGLYVSDEGGTKVEVLAYLTTTTRKPKRIILTSDLLIAETDKVLALRDAIRDEFFPDFRRAHRPKHVR